MPRPDEPSRENFSPTPERFREDAGDERPYTDPLSGVEYPVRPEDVLDPYELHEYRQARARRARRARRYTG